MKNRIKRAVIESRIGQEVEFYGIAHDKDGEIVRRLLNGKILGYDPKENLVIIRPTGNYLTAHDQYVEFRDIKLKRR